MNIDIRKYIIDNFKNDSKDVIKKAIDASIEENDEVTLPGMGVFMELLWNGSQDSLKEEILNILEKQIKKETK